MVCWLTLKFQYTSTKYTANHITRYILENISLSLFQIQFNFKYLYFEQQIQLQPIANISLGLAWRKYKYTMKDKNSLWITIYSHTNINTSCMAISVYQRYQSPQLSQNKTEWSVEASASCQFIILNNQIHKIQNNTNTQGIYKHKYKHDCSL